MPVEFPGDDWVVLLLLTGNERYVNIVHEQLRVISGVIISLLHQ